MHSFASSTLVFIMRMLRTKSGLRQFICPLSSAYQPPAVAEINADCWGQPRIYVWLSQLSIKIIKLIHTYAWRSAVFKTNFAMRRLRVGILLSVLLEYSWFWLWYLLFSIRDDIGLHYMGKNGLGPFAIKSQVVQNWAGYLTVALGWILCSKKLISEYSTPQYELTLHVPRYFKSFL